MRRRKLHMIHYQILMSLAVVLGLLILENASAKETITFKPYTKKEEQYLINGGTHNLARMVADFGAAFQNNPFRFADMNAFWIYKFEFNEYVTATAIMDIGNEFKVSIATSKEGKKNDYVVALEEKNRVHDNGNKKVRTIEFSNYFDKPSKTLWIKFEDNFPQDGWGPFLDSFTLEYTVSSAVKPIDKLATMWANIKVDSKN